MDQTMRKGVPIIMTYGEGKLSDIDYRLAPISIPDDHEIIRLAGAWLGDASFTCDTSATDVLGRPMLTVIASWC
jgi:hypothetical protein